MKKNRNKLALIIAVIAVIVGVIGFSFALFRITINGQKEQKITSGYVAVVLDEASCTPIQLENAFPITDEEGKQLSACRFSVQNTGTTPIQYQVFLDDSTIKNNEVRINDKYIKYQLKLGTRELATALVSSTGINPNRMIHEKVLNVGNTDTYELRLWVDYDATSEAMEKTFSGVIRIEAVQTNESEEEFQCFEYTSDLETVTITGYKDECSRNVEIPQQIENKNVTIIGGSAFKDKNIESLVLPTTIKRIETFAFQNNKLKTLTLPNSVTYMGQAAFDQNELTTVKLSEKLGYIPHYAFSDNFLTSLTIPASVTSVGRDSLWKSATSNPNLTTIINKTGKSFDWQYATQSTNANTFETGTIVHQYGNIIVTNT